MKTGGWRQLYCLSINKHHAIICLNKYDSITDGLKMKMHNEASLQCFISRHTLKKKATEIKVQNDFPLCDCIHYLNVVWANTTQVSELV